MKNLGRSKICPRTTRHWTVLVVLISQIFTLSAVNVNAGNDPDGAADWPVFRATVEGVTYPATITAPIPGPPCADCELDAVFVNRGQNDRRCLGDGTGQFSCNAISSSNELSLGVALGRMNDDDFLDAVIANSNNRRNQLCMGNGFGGFTCGDFHPDFTSSAAVALGDLDNNGRLDAVFANTNEFDAGQNRACTALTTGYTCYNVSESKSESRGVALGFVDDDVFLDAVFANQGANAEVCLGMGSDGFTCSSIGGSEGAGTGVALGDLNDDGKLDAVFSRTLQNPNVACLGNGSGLFTCARINQVTATSTGVALGDLNGDGHLDAVFSNEGPLNANRVCLGDGTGGFSCANVSEDNNESSGVALGDLNEDGHLDAVFANFAARNRVCFGTGEGTFSSCDDVTEFGFSTVGVALGRIAPETIARDSFESDD